MKNAFRVSLNLLLGVTILCFSLISTFSLAQSTGEKSISKQDLKSRLYFGGGFGLQFGSLTLVEISPLVGYKLTPKWSVGISPTYKYFKYKDYYSGSSYSSTNVWGGSIFSRYDIFQNVFAHVEYEALFYNTKITGGLTEMQQYNSFLVGGGYQQRISGNAGMYLLVLWNLNDTPDSPYNNPIFRVGFNIGL
jgi:hypothetical protein